MKWRIVATYRYTDERGALLYEVVRLDPRDFKQRRPDGNGGWIWSLDGVRRVPYRLAELLAAIGRGESLYVVEGEKDADTLAALGLCATTNAGGASWPWSPEFAEYFRGAPRIIVIPDCDDGRR